MDAEAFGLRRFAYAETKYYGVFYRVGLRMNRGGEIQKIEPY